jgi:HTH-type transcriptional regulator, sugar sensing transcriptional regulator
MEVEKVLKEIGFQDVEIKVYLFLLKKGKSSQQVISDETGILRQTIYEVMKKMEVKGYVTSSLIGKRKEYLAINPEIILNQIKSKEENFMSIIPKLNNLMTNKSNFFVQNFVGIKGLKNLFNMTLDSKAEISWFCNRKMSDKIFEEFYWHNYSQKRLKKKIKIKLLIEPDDKKDWNTSKEFMRQTKRSDFIKGVKSSFVIFEDKVLIYSQEEENLRGVLIQDNLIKGMFKGIFEKFWKESKE